LFGLLAGAEQLGGADPGTYNQRKLFWFGHYFSGLLDESEQPICATEPIDIAEVKTVEGTGCYAFHRTTEIPRPKISASHDATGKPSNRRGTFNLSALHLMQEPLGSPQAAQEFSILDFIASPGATQDKYRFRFLHG
jgi:hypothetical protein